ncbi:MAG: hypothetical protein U5N85_16660 [Arcicella sp.]|nr:hypothetical protein [Arcicella sp.]
MRKQTFALIIIFFISIISAFTIKKERLEDVFHVKINQEVLYRGRAYETLGEATSTNWASPYG